MNRIHVMPPGNYGWKAKEIKKLFNPTVCTDNDNTAYVELDKYNNDVSKLAEGYWNTINQFCLPLLYNLAKRS